MLINKNRYGYSNHKKYITGRGFVDSLSNVFNSLKSTVAPAFRTVSSYMNTNKDLIAKPLLGAVGSLAATGLTAGVPALLNYIKNRARGRTHETSQPTIPDDPKYKEILQSLMIQPSKLKGESSILMESTIPVSSIIGSGFGSGIAVRNRKHHGAGIKTF